MRCLTRSTYMSIQCTSLYAPAEAYTSVLFFFFHKNTILVVQTAGSQLHVNTYQLLHINLKPFTKEIIAVLSTGQLFCCSRISVL